MDLVLLQVFAYGIATVKAFADSLGIKTVGISSLEALSLISKPNKVICPLIDARNNNVYNEIFEFTPEKSNIKRNASFDNINAFLEELKSLKLEYTITFIGDGAVAHKEKILEYLPKSDFIENNDLSAKNVGLYAYAYSQIETFPTVEPLYLRKSEAEKYLEEKNKK